MILGIRMNSKFRGFKNVYQFTLKNAISALNYKLLTIFVSIVIIALAITLTIVSAKPKKTDIEKRKENLSTIETVYVIDESGLAPTDYSEYIKQSEAYELEEILFDSTLSNDAMFLENNTNNESSILVHIQKSNLDYQFKVTIPEGSVLDEEDVQEVVNAMSNYFNSNKLYSLDMSDEALGYLYTPIMANNENLGDMNEVIDKKEETVGLIIKILVPLIYGLVMYFLLLSYGQSISKSVSVEKTSKLIETLLISVHPYALITGKILATVSMALIQFSSWIASIFIGLYSGNYIAKLIYPEYESSALSFIALLRDNIGNSAFTIPSIILAILFFISGFLFFCFLAGLAGSIASKPEDLGNAQTIFVMPILIGWIGSYLALLMENYTLINILRYIPFSSPFSVPVELLVGTVSLFEGIIMFVILNIFTFLVMIFSSKLFKGLLLYNGQKLSFKTITAILSTK